MRDDPNDLEPSRIAQTLAVSLCVLLSLNPVPLRLVCIARAGGPVCHVGRRLTRFVVRLRLRLCCLVYVGHCVSFQKDIYEHPFRHYEKWLKTNLTPYGAET
jgi:hypothetical protein